MPGIDFGAFEIVDEIAPWLPRSGKKTSFKEGQRVYFWLELSQFSGEGPVKFEWLLDGKKQHEFNYIIPPGSWLAFRFVSRVDNIRPGNWQLRFNSTISEIMQQSFPLHAFQVEAAAPTEEPSAIVLAGLSADSMPAGATVLLDGVPIGQTPSTFQVEPGQHAVTLRLPGFQDFSGKFNFVAGKTTTVAVTLIPEASLLDRVTGVLRDILVEGRTIQDSLAKFGFIPGITANIVNELIELFTIELTGTDGQTTRILLAGAPLKISSVFKLKPEAAVAAANELIEAGAAKLNARAIANPKAIGQVLNSLSEEQLTKVFEALEGTAAGRAASISLINAAKGEVIRRATTGLGLVTSLRGILSIVAGFFGLIFLLKFIGFDLPGFTATLRKEIPEAPGLAVWQAIEAAQAAGTTEAWQLANETNANYLKFIELADKATSRIVSLNPLLSDVYKSSSDAQRLQHGTFQAVIDAALKADLPPELLRKLAALRIEVNNVLNTLNGVQFVCTEAALASAEILVNDAEGKLDDLLQEARAAAATTAGLKLVQDEISSFISRKDAISDQVQAKCAELFLPPGAVPAKLRINIFDELSNPKAADIFIDDAFINFASTVEVEVEAGADHRLQLRREGFELVDRLLLASIFRPDETTVENINLTAIEEAINTGNIFVRSNPSNAIIFIDGQPTTFITNRTIRDLAPGRYIIEIERDRYVKPAAIEISLKAGETLTADFGDLELLPAAPPVQVFNQWKVNFTAVDAATNVLITGAKIIIDNIDTGKRTTGFIFLDPAGSFTARIEAFDYIPNEFTLTTEALPPGQAQPFIDVEVPLTRKEPFEVPPIFNPPALSRPEIPLPPPLEKRPLVIDIETTGILPWQSRIIAIGYLDPARPDAGPITIIDEDEQKILLEFLDVFSAGRFNQLIGYNVSFDYRFIFSRCMFYRLPAREIFDAELIDMMQLMQQVKQAFVFGFNRPGTLDEWSRLLLGRGKLGTDKELLLAWNQRDIDFIARFNQNDLTLTYSLFILAEFSSRLKFEDFSRESTLQSREGVSPRLSSSPSLLTIPEAGLPRTWTARCPRDLSEHIVPIEQKEFICPIDGSIILRPTT